MRKAEIDRKFDEIVDFSGVEKFLDTPIKRYSSGMKVRLAFSVAAHLEPEILVIDEVLAVGDTDFQKRCIGKMQSVATTGRTVLFVSHNLGAMRTLCTRGLLLSDGVIAYSGEINEALKYYGSRFSIQEQSDLTFIKNRQGTGDVRFTEINFNSTNASGTVGTGDGLYIDLKLESKLPQCVAEIAIGFFNSDGVKIAWIGTRLTGFRVELNKGICAVRCSLPEIPLMQDYYSVTLHVSVGGEVSDWMQHVTGFEIVEGDFYGTGQRPPSNWGMITLRQDWCMS
jgi:lipopolysaccharide transport system ATP-binding protein